MTEQPWASEQARAEREARVQARLDELNARDRLNLSRRITVGIAAVLLLFVFFPGFASMEPTLRLVGLVTIVVAWVQTGWASSAQWGSGPVQRENLPWSCRPRARSVELHSLQLALGIIHLSGLLPVAALNQMWIALLAAPCLGVWAIISHQRTKATTELENQLD